MIEATLFLFIFILILLVISFTAICYAIEEGDNDNKKNNKRFYSKNEEVKKDL